MHHSKSTYYIQFLLIFSFFFLKNEATGCDVKSDASVLIAQHTDGAVLSKSIYDLSSNHKEYPKEEREEEQDEELDQELEEDNQEEVREKVGENYFLSILSKTSSFEIFLTQKVTKSALKFHKEAHRHNCALHIFYCVYLC